ncbi:MAG: cytidylate kinase-like family protein [Deltaproteobacteria bacterium]|nr:cytidylate kinase-like family protein [Deltaproteobacteria bacterium]
MAIITISRGCFSHGKEIAECVADRLGYECISQEVLLEASRTFDVPEAKLVASLHDAPGLIARITHVRERIIDGIQAALLEHVVKDNVVYHGFAGQILLDGIDHVLKVRVIADIEERIKLLQRRKPVSREAALDLIDREDQERAEWYRSIYRIDMNDPRLYDMVLHIGRLTIVDACEIVCQTATGSSFRTTARSSAALADLALESHVKVAIQGVCKADVSCRDGIVQLRVQGQKLKPSGVASPHVQHQLQDRIRDDLYDEIVAVVSIIPGVKDIDCNIDTPYYV